MAAVLAPACSEEQPEGYVLVHQTPGELQPCPTPQRSTAVVRVRPDGEVNCGIAFGEDAAARLDDALTQASGGDPDDYFVSDSLEASRSVVAAVRSDAAGWRAAVGVFETCNPDDSDDPTLAELLTDCPGCEIECEEAIDGCDEGCGCESPPSCGPEILCCPGELCVDGPPLGLTLGGEPRCVAPCADAADCGDGDCCSALEGSDLFTCLPCP